MRAGASKEDGFVRNIIDKQPVCFDVAFPKTIPFAAEFVRACGCGERFIALQTNKDSAQFPKVDPAFRHSFLSRKNLVLWMRSFIYYRNTSANNSLAVLYRFAFARYTGIAQFRDCSPCFRVWAFC